MSEEPTQEPTQEPTSAIPPETLLEQMGGWSGFVHSTLPVLAFVPCNALWGLRIALIVSLAVAGLVFVVRLFRQQKLMPSISGLLVVVLCALIAYRMGDAKGYFVWGIWVSGIYGLIAVVSIIVKWPLIGVVWSALDGKGQGWQKNRTARRWYSLATSFWIIVFAARAIVQQWLYAMDEATILGIARIAMGWPLTLLAIAGTVWAIKRSKHSLLQQASRAQEDS